MGQLDKGFKTMIDGTRYIETVRANFAFLVTEFDFQAPQANISGNAYYNVEYTDPSRVISVSLENIPEYFQVIIFLLQDGVRPDYDDKTRTLHLNQLNAQIYSKIDKAEIDSNHTHFQQFEAEEELERTIQKSAKDLRLCLRHWDQVVLD